MALIKCPECKKKISEYARSCPNCGYIITPLEIKKIKKEKTNTSLFTWIIIVILLIIGINTCDDTSGEDYLYPSTNEASINPEKIITKYSKVDLNVRESPRKNSKVIRVLKPNEAIKTTGKASNNYLPILNNKNKVIGWCHKDYLQNKELSKSQLDKTKKESIKLNQKKSQKLQNNSKSKYSTNSYITISDTYAATSEEYYDDMFEYITNKDDQAFNILLMTGKITILKKDTELIVVDGGFFSSIVRKRGTIQKLWVPNDFIKQQ